MLDRDGLFEGVVPYLAARKLAKRDPRRVSVGKGACDICIEHKISHEELSEIVGTTRPGISLFMQRFRNLGLSEMGAERFLTVKEDKLAAYLAQSPRGEAAFHELPQPARRQPPPELSRPSAPLRAAR